MSFINKSKCRTLLNYIGVLTAIGTLSWLGYTAFTNFTAFSSEENKETATKEQTKTPLLREKIRKYSKAAIKLTVTIFLNELFLWNPSQDIHFPNHAWMEKSQSLLLHLIQSKKYDFYLLALAHSTDEKDNILNLLVESGCVSTINESNPNKLDSNRIKFHTSTKGRYSILNEINPALHIEVIKSDCNEIINYTKNTLIIKPSSYSEIKNITDGSESTLITDTTPVDSHENLKKGSIVYSNTFDLSVFELSIKTS